MRGELPRISSEVSLGNTDDKTTASKSESNASTAASKATAVIAGTESSQVSYDGSGSTDHSTTNVQVEGVDEGDIIKTDGKYIYQVNRERVVVAKAYPAQDMKIESMITFRDEEFYPLEMYLDENKLVVVGNSSTSVKVFIFDISNKSDIKQIRNFEIEGAYISSRKIGSYLYMVANKYADYYYIMQNESANPTPVYRDSASGDDFLDIDLKQVCYFPGHIQPNYMIVAGINVDKVDEKAHISTFLGSGQNIYSSLENLYIAVTDYNVINKTEVKNDKKPKAEVSETTVESSVGNSTAVTTKPSIAIDMRPNISQENTLIYKFYLNNGIATYICKGNVPGRILNQFSMDEHNRYFRIATTTGEIWRNDEFTSKNNIYVLDDMLNIKGKVLDIAPGEQIYSVRFMGDRAYMVTFKLTDPLFVIDLKNPQEPRILGALKIPGYSDYLHPYDENHIIGFGKDSVEVKGQAFYMGMKIAMFDVSDVSNPIQEFSEIIGDRGTDSELLRNHKALLFSKEKGLMAFPVTVMEINSENKFAHGGFPNYGQFAFQGAYVYNVDPVKGFTLRGKITHLDRDDMLRAGSGWYSSDKNINRIIYIDDTLYTLSNKILKANGLDDMKEKSELEIP